MTIITEMKNMEDVPCNYGYLVGGKKYSGHADTSENGACVKLLDTDKQHLHGWFRRGYMKWQLNKGETGEDVWETVGKRRALLNNNSMVPCPHELEQGGECPLRYQPDHERYHYHFAQRRRGVVVRNVDGKPLCRYHIGGPKKCWEGRNGPHRKLFAHR